MQVSQKIVLFVEDEALILMDVADMLSGAGYTVIGVSSADRASVMLAAGLVFDILVTDVDMPGTLNGGFLRRGQPHECGNRRHLGPQCLRTDAVCSHVRSQACFTVPPPRCRVAQPAHRRLNRGGLAISTPRSMVPPRKTISRGYWHAYRHS